MKKVRYDTLMTTISYFAKAKIEWTKIVSDVSSQGGD